MIKGIFIFIFITLICFIDINKYACSEGRAISGNVVKERMGNINLYYLITKSKRKVFLGDDEDISHDQKRCVKEAVSTNKIISIEGELFKDREGVYFFFDDIYKCKSSNKKVNQTNNITGSFNFVECEGGIGGAMHISVVDPKTGDDYMMTAYRGTHIEDICDLKPGTALNITYKQGQSDDNYIIKILRK